MSEMEQKINDLSLMEQNIQQITNQKKNFQNQLVEIQSAKGELNSEEAYKIIGNFMFKKNSKDIKEELSEQEELLKARIKSFEIQEQEIEKKFKKMQEDLLKELSKKKEDGEKNG